MRRSRSSGPSRITPPVRRPRRAERAASLAVALARQSGLAAEECDALYFAARLRNAGALGNGALAKGEALPERAAMMARWDIPADGARICRRIAALPSCADTIRWQAECWDGTGFPDRLRWSGIPKAAQLLHAACAYVAIPEPEEAFSAITAESGRTYSPESARAFTMWFHLNGGEVPAAETPYGALLTGDTPVEQILSLLSDRIDTHNATPGRARRVAARAHAVGRALDLPPHELRSLEHAALLFGIGERANRSSKYQFAALARLGIQTRARNAASAADLLEGCALLRDTARIVGSRGEWYDGTGGPAGLRHDAIPVASSILGAAIAYDEVERDRSSAHRRRSHAPHRAPRNKLQARSSIPKSCARSRKTWKRAHDRTARTHRRISASRLEEILGAMNAGASSIRSWVSPRI